ncbi:ATP-dependent protease ATP-binding subunit HslU [Campylobacter hyointestinalis]|uniref:ATP-dependent protease ATP-binding subunit HslU n=1 Tax=Campylobacter hyointestinalis subsp. hyointestinalis TaxID=91352 RepID=A0A2S5J467_CAMHY|nr:HslU--HslV peptidase ATPase subunit [Campylobacter hyointestinalis]MBT0611489.1 HslU--HslV peptidase ATPase subunit [Campylobacter hyointestinalis subsp. hyointestinalis]MDY2999029.1 HslU--HslV peptidase ATPase subunit [Campylobacter hyointestinalis]PPB54340.1 ATP-dependent protease ATP-binding subunit HslU [Campylobacter hyointestinalis subsp. hyointestinalis]PPB59054.1 ATP-dependent protease ATP-binding subunit HslU [Campylobacter hyointestinalis subsp. hyointestinalis]PPB70120.1 ATP-depe
MNLTPKEIVKFLDDYVIGQDDAKKVIAIALRNRYRRLKLNKEEQEDIIPKNILMIGSTGVGKTEIARRLSKMFGLPFIKVEASKYTEVGFVGRDVESMVRDLAMASLNLVKKEEREKNSSKIDEYIEKKILEKLLPPLPKGASEDKLKDYEASYEKMKDKLKKGELDHLNIELDIDQATFETGSNMPPDMAAMQESFIKVIGIASKKVKKEFKVKDAKEALKTEASEKILDMDSIKIEALRRAENEGIIFIDEIDKVAVSSSNSSRQDPSKEGVQRDLLPIVEGSSVTTKFGSIKTDHILFIAAGAFHISKPSDLIPELQGRFPLRVNLDSLDENALVQILTKPKNSLLKQYKALLKTEDVELEFDDESIKEIAKITQNANQNVEDIGARRLHTVIERVLEDISFKADEYKGQKITITKELVREKLDFVCSDQDLAKYIL